MPVVALNKDAKLLCVYDSITLAAKAAGASYAALNGKLLKGKPYKRVLYVREPEYRERWFNGTTDVYRFPTIKEIRHNRALKSWENRSKEERKRRLTNTCKGRDEYNKKYVCKKVICIETGVIYESIAECARQLGLSDQRTRARIKTGRTTKGITLKLYDNRNE